MKRARVVVVGSCNVDLTTFTDRFPMPGETIFGDRGARRAIVTLGERGSLLAKPAGVDWLPAVRVDTRDTTGAGDAFIGSFATFVVEGVDERGAVARANLYAALSTTAVGTQKSFVGRDEFERQWKRATLAQ